MNGLEVYRRAKEVHPEIIAIVVSGYAKEMHDLIEEALKEDAHMFLEKPVDMEEMLTIVDGVLAEKKRVMSAIFRTGL